MARRSPNNNTPRKMNYRDQWNSRDQWDSSDQWNEHLNGDADGLGAVRGMVFAIGTVMLAAVLGAILWLGWDHITSHLADAASTVADYFHTGPGCPGADYGWLGRCSQAPKGGL